MLLSSLLRLLPLLLSSHALPKLPQLGNAPLQRQASIFERVKAPVCRSVDIPLCRDIPYNRTILPNPLIDGLDPQSLQSQTEHFKPLIRTKCSPHILFFVCSVFAPMCPEQLPQAVTSCRSVCEEVRRDCIKIFNEFDFPWPPVLNCSRFPVPPELCMRPEPTAPERRPPDILPSANSRRAKVPECPQDLVDLDPADPEAKCAFRCEKSTMFRKDLKEKARLWLMMCAFLNVCVASFTVCSFGIDRYRFAFPERSVCFLAFCSLLSSLPHFLRSLFGFDAIACAQLPAGPKFLLLDGPTAASASASSSVPFSLCLVSFLLHFYFSLAASMWWLTLTFTWYLSATRKWAEEAIGRRSVQLHLFAWTIPALFAVFALWTHRLDASELSGLCSVGNADQNALLWLWIVPRSVSTLLGLYLILAGFSSMCKERNCFRRRGTDTSKLEKFMLCQK
uniref:Frizzled-4 n=1 Tax=Globodera pallida TaxID=36090 RepID=A0A183C1X6_GLOPA